MEWLSSLFLEHSALQAVVVLSLISAIGLGLGRVHFWGVSLGVTFVFFAGILAGHFGLSVDPELLKKRINARVDGMFEAGLVDEVRALCDQGFTEALTAREAIGYKEVVEALEGRCSMEEASEAIKLATRRYAKRQRSWWRHDERVRWVVADDGDVARMADEIQQLL